MSDELRDGELSVEWVATVTHCRRLPSSWPTTVTDAPKRPVSVSVALSSDGQLLVTGGGDGIVRLWDVTGHTPSVQQALIGDAPVRTVTLSASGRLLGSGHQNHSVQLWDVTDPIAPARRGSFTTQAGAVVSLAFSPDARLLAVGSDADHGASSWFLTTRRVMHSRYVELYDVSVPGSPLWRGLCHDGAPPVAFSRSGELLVTGGDRSHTVLFDLTEFDLTASDAPYVSVTKAAEFRRYEDLNWWKSPVPSAVAVSPAGQLVASDTGREGMGVALWDTADPHAPVSVSQILHPGRVYATSFSPNGRLLAVGGLSIVLWDLAIPSRPVRRAVLDGRQGMIGSVAFSDDGRWLAAGNCGGTADLYKHPEPSELPAVPFLGAEEDQARVGRVSVDRDGVARMMREIQQEFDKHPIRVPVQTDGPATTGSSGNTTIYNGPVIHGNADGAQLAWGNSTVHQTQHHAEQIAPGFEAIAQAVVRTLEGLPSIRAL